jgi:hypothetical protein
VIGRVALPRFWCAAVVTFDLVLVAQVSPPAAIVALVALAAVVKIGWRALLLIACGLFSVLPLASTVGLAGDADGYATIGLALVAIAVAMLAREERRRLRCGG